MACRPAPQKLAERLAMPVARLPSLPSTHGFVPRPSVPFGGTISGVTDSMESTLRALTTADDLRVVYKQPSTGAVAKDVGHLDRHCRRFIEMSPFLCLGTMGPEGLGDVTPRGGEPGFVHVLDDHHLAMPDRPGNNRLDSLTNLVRNPGVGLLFFIPGFEDLLRVNGVGRITTDPDLMSRFVAHGKPPRSVLVVEVREAYLHCPKAIRRARLWEPETWPDRASYPTPGQVYREQLSLDAEASEIDERLERGNQASLW